MSGPRSCTSVALARLTSSSIAPSPSPNACSRMSSIANWCEGSVEPRESSFRSSCSDIGVPAEKELRRLRRTPARKLRPGMSGIIAIHDSTARTRADLGPCISPSLRSATRFAVFSSNWNESSSIESWSSASGSLSTTNDVPFSSPLWISGAAARGGSAISWSLTASAPAAYVCRRICAASNAMGPPVVGSLKV